LPARPGSRWSAGLSLRVAKRGPAGSGFGGQRLMAGKQFDQDFDGVDEGQIRREKAKARQLRNSRWWKEKIAQGRCYYCGREVAPEELTMDHVVPLARGGLSSKNNLVPCCKECNNDKKSRLALEWQGYD